MAATLQEWLENNTTDAHAVRVRVGERGSQPTVACIIVANGVDASKFPSFDPIHVDSWEEAHDSVVQALEGAGWGIEPGQEVARVHLVGESGSQQKTWSRTRAVENRSNGLDATTQVCQEMIRMASEMRRGFAVVCTALSEQTQGREEAVLEMIQAHRAQIESQAHAELVQVLAEAEAEVEPDADPLRTTAAGIIEGLAGQILGGANQTAGISAKEVVMRTLQSDPELVKELVADPSVIELFMNATEPDPADLLPDTPVSVPMEPPPPSPMPE
ncbi:MAG: hypothetical protein KAX80_06865 [Planctomycetes bacterium]|nr:hypothetical protein [Planctomycetota bacterium]